MCSREDIFQAVTACTLRLALPGDGECLHRCRRARAETIRTVYKAKVKWCQRVPVGGPRVNPSCAGINLSLTLLLTCSMATRSGSLLLPGFCLLGLLWLCVLYPLGCTGYRQSYTLIYGPLEACSVHLVPKGCAVVAVPQRLCCWHFTQVWRRCWYCRFETEREQIQA